MNVKKDAKVVFWSKGGVYYKRKGRKVYVNRFGNSDVNEINRTHYNQLFLRLIKPVIDKIVTKILPETWLEEIRENAHEYFTCLTLNGGEDYCLRLIASRRILLKIIIDEKKYNFFKDAYNNGIEKNYAVMARYGGIVETFTDEYLDVIVKVFLQKFNTIIEEEDNALAPVFLPDYRRVAGNAYWSSLPSKIAQDYRSYADTLGASLSNVVQQFINDDCKPFNISALVQSLLNSHPNTSVGCDWSKQHEYNKDEDSDDRCPVCLDNFKENDIVITLLCGGKDVKETIHKECLGPRTLQKCMVSQREIEDCF